MVTLEQMLFSSVHLGHKVQQWNPKMNIYIYGERNGIHIIDLLQTLICLKKVCAFLTKSAKQGKTVLFVCTKKQFSSIVQDCAHESGSFFVTQRWLGGMLTNWFTIKKCINNLQVLSKQENELIVSRTKKEYMIIKKKKAKLEKYLQGVIFMDRVPDIVIVIGQMKELNAVRECLKLGVCLITILDTNCDPTLTDFLVPANDDSISSVALILKSFSQSLTSVTE